MELPADAHLTDLITRQARLHVALGSEFGKRPLVLPNGQFFPDRFEQSRAGAARLVARMQLHAGMQDIPIVPQILDESAAANATSCSSGACAPAPNLQQPRLNLDDDVWTLNLGLAELAHPVGLTTLVARALSAVFLEETLPDGQRPAEPFGITQDLVGVNLGFGALLLEGSHIYSKSCGGPQIAQLTSLNTRDLGVMTALFAQCHGLPIKPALKVLSATQRSALKLGRDWAKANTHLSKTLTVDPELLLTSAFELEPPAPSLLAFLDRRSKDDQRLEEALLLAGPGDASHTPAASSRRNTSTTSRDDDDLRALVESSLAELRSE